MHFVQSAFLAAAAAVIVPIIVHLMFRSQARRVNLGTLRFLKQVLERNARRQRIMRWLLLALRMAVVGLLAALFARPFLIAAGPSGDKKLLMILLDGSASMELKGEPGRLIDVAISEAKRIVAEQGSKTRIEVAFFDHAVRPLGSNGETNEKNDPGAAGKLLAHLAPPKLSHRATNYGAALAWARDISLRTGRGTQELHIFTDLQQSGLDWSEVEPMPEQVHVYLHDVGRAVVNNLAVTEARPIRVTVRPGETATVQATLFNGGAFPIEELPVVLKLEGPQGKLSQREKVKLEPASIATVNFEIPALDAGLWSGTVSLEADDDLKFDNARHVAIFAATPYRVLLADGEPSESPVLSETYFLDTALRLAGPDERYADSPFETATVPFQPGDSLPSLDKFDVVVLANVASVPTADARRLAEFVEGGGGLIVFGGEHVTAKGYQALAEVGLTPGEIAGPAHSYDLPFRIESWDEKHPLLRPFNDPQHGDLRRLAFRAYTKIKVDGSLPEPNPDSRSELSTKVRVLATFRGGDPALLGRTYGQGTALWFASVCDREWSEWPSTRLFVPLVHQMVGQPLGLNDGGPVRASLIDSTSNLPAETAPGVVERKRHWQVINSSPRESETERCTAEEFANRFQLTLQTDDGTVTSNVATAAALNMDLRNDEQWHWVALVLVGLLLLEAFVANRTVS